MHSRRAAKDVIEVIGESFRGRVILHWYQDSFRELERALERGFYFSVNEAMLFRSERSRGVVARIPYDRLLTETDGTDRRAVEPCDIPRVLAHLRDLRRREEEASRERIWTTVQAATAEIQDP